MVIAIEEETTGLLPGTAWSCRQPFLHQWFQSVPTLCPCVWLARWSTKACTIERNKNSFVCGQIPSPDAKDKQASLSVRCHGCSISKWIPESRCVRLRATIRHTYMLYACADVVIYSFYSLAKMRALVFTSLLAEINDVNNYPELWTPTVTKRRRQRRPQWMPVSS